MSELVRIAAEGATPGQLAKAFDAFDRHFAEAGCSAIEAATAASRLEGEETLTEGEFDMARAWLDAERVAREASGLEELDIVVA